MKEALQEFAYGVLLIASTIFVLGWALFFNEVAAMSGVY